MKIETYKFNPGAGNEPELLYGKSPQEFLKSKYVRGSIFGLDNLKKEGLYRLAGWVFNFRPYMKKFLVKQYDNWTEQWAINKTDIHNSTYGHIDQIVELPHNEITLDKEDSL